MAEIFNYRIDRNNILVSVGDNWGRFAIDNAAEDSVLPDNVIGRSLDTCIEDDDTRALYALVLDSVRGSNRPVAFGFRCDSPATRRFCELRITPCADGSVDFESAILRTESREPVFLLQTDVPRDPDVFLKTCSTCKRVAAGGEGWIEIEQAMQRLNLADRERPPRISHGMCADCYKTIIESL